MRVQITGDRNWTDRSVIEKALRVVMTETGHAPVVVHGAARGADSLSGEVAEELGCTVEVYPADWLKYGKAAGPIRNKQMLDTGPDVVLAFHDDLENSKGTRHCVTEAEKRGLEVRKYTTESFSDEAL